MLEHSTRLSALIIDDEPLAHQVLLHHLKDQTDIHVVGQCYNATEALQLLASEKVDLLFLDINMPALTGIEMLRVLAEKPQVIIISAYQEYALEGFELDVTDYLLKPVSKDRFTAALDKVRKRQEQKPKNEPASHKNQTSLVLKVGRDKAKFKLSDIEYLEAYGNYVKLWSKAHDGTDVAMTLVNSTLKQILQALPSESFIQIHKSFVINKSHVCGQGTDNVKLTSGESLKVGKSFKKQLTDLL